MIPVGKHKGKCPTIELVSWGKDKSDNAQIAIPMEVTDGDAKGERGWLVCSLGSEDAIRYTMKALRTLGWKTDDLTNLDGIADNVVMMTVEEDMWTPPGQAEPVRGTRIRYVDKVDRRFAFKNPLSDQEKLGLSARLKAYAIQSKIEAGGQVGSAVARPPARQQGAAPQSYEQGTVSRPSAGGDLEELPF